MSDHDAIRSVRYAYANPVVEGVHLIPATELTAYDYERGHRVHILCFWPDDCAALEDFSKLMSERRYNAVMQSCRELEELCPQFKTAEALEFARMGILPEGMYRNRKYAEPFVSADGVPLEVQDALYDPQTSGGLLFSVAATDAPALVAELEGKVPAVQRVGEVGEYRGGAYVRVLTSAGGHDLDG